MEFDTNKILEEAIKLEQNMAGLYLTYAELFAEDYHLWNTLMHEEYHHASLLKNIRSDFSSVGTLPSGTYPDNIEQLVATNKDIVNAIEKIKMNPIRELAFKTALSVEESAGELHYQKLTEVEPTSSLVKLFQKLNHDDKDHAKRIIKYMKDKNIEL